MALSNDEKENLKKILVSIYGQNFAAINPTEETLELTERMLTEIHECNRRIQILFKSLHCSIIGHGFLRRCLKAVADIVLTEPHTFQGCVSIALNYYKHPIYISGMH